MSPISVVRLRCGAFVACWLLSIAAASAAKIDLNAYRQYDFGRGGAGLTSADFDEDGLPDVVAVQRIADGVLAVLLSRPDGTFVSSSIPGLSSLGSVRAADFDEDTHLDLIVSALDEIILFRGDGAGSFAESTRAASGGFNEDLFVADLDGDGHADVVVANRSADAARVFLGDGTMGLTAGATLAAGLDPEGMSGGDLDHDSDVDLVVGSRDRVTLFAGAGDGSFVVSGDLGSIASTDVLVHDVDGDGHLDVLFGQGAGLGVALGDGTGGLLPSNLFASNGGIGQISVADLDRDGKLDAIGCGTRLFVFRGRGAGVFAAARPLPTPNPVSSVTAVDFDGDGFVDLAAGLIGGGSVVVFPNWLGRRLPKPERLGTLEGAEGLVAADFDEDGSIDLLVSEVDAPHLQYFRGNGRGGFANGTHVGSDALRSMLVADLNEDGHADVAGASTDAGVRILIGDGHGGFAGGNVILGGSPLGIATSDFNADGHVDVAAAVGSFGVRLLFGDGDGNFAVASLGVGPGGATSVAAADVDEDGDPDLLVTHASPESGLSILSGDGMGGFGSPVRIAPTIRPTVVIPADFDGDGHLDLATTDAQPLHANTVCILLSDGAGGFGPPTSYLAGTDTRDVVPTDFDGDGRLDLAVVLDVGFSILPGRAGGGFDPLIPFGVGRFCRHGVVADFDRDGLPDLAVDDERTTYVMVNRSR